MIKYKLIKIYPGSPVLNTEIEYTGNEWKCNITDFALYGNPENYSEFWKVIIPSIIKNFDVLSIIRKSSTVIFLTKDWNDEGAFLKDLTRKDWNKGRDNIQFIFSHFDIHSIRRQADHTKFTVGDNVKEGIIKAFRIIKNNYLQYVCESKKGWINIEEAKHIASPIYEILSFIGNENHPSPGYIIYVRNNKVLTQPEQHLAIGHYITSKNVWKIHSVKRIYDDKIFTLKDVVEHSYDKRDRGVITSFKLGSNNNLLVYFTGKRDEDANFKYSNNLSVLILSKQLLFKTQKGSLIYEGDDFWFVNKNLELNKWLPLTMDSLKENKSFLENQTLFAIKLNAEKYIKKNTILFVTDDGINVYEGNTYYAVQSEINSRYKYPGQVQKITITNFPKGISDLDSGPTITDMKNSVKRFSIYKNAVKFAREWKIMNTPCLSINDVATVYVTANQYSTCQGNTQFAKQAEKLRNIVKNKL